MVLTGGFVDSNPTDPSSIPVIRLVKNVHDWRKNWSKLKTSVLTIASLLNGKFTTHPSLGLTTNLAYLNHYESLKAVV